MAPAPTVAEKEAAAAAVKERDASKAPGPKHGDPAENLGPHESVIGVRTGSEATVESGTDPVLPSTPGSGLSAMTEVRNKDLKERDKAEMEKRGPSGGVFEVSVSFAGLMMVEVDGQLIPRSGSFTGHFHEEFKLRPFTKEELAEHVPSAAPGDKQAVERRAGDLIKGAGQGGGGNPMKTGEARGTTSGVTQPAGGASVTSGTPARGETSRGPK